mgnify:CR=1 FL=1
MQTEADGADTRKFCQDADFWRQILSRHLLGNSSDGEQAQDLFIKRHDLGQN